MTDAVLITGAARGVGLALCGKYLGEGRSVVACPRADPGKDLEDLGRRFGPKLLIRSMDVADDRSVQAACEAIRASVASMSVLINNAAVYPREADLPLERIDFGVAQATYNVNSLGPLRVTKAFLPLLEKGGDRVIANISSEAGSIGDCRRTAEFSYCMSKAALNMESALLKNYLEPRGYKILAVHPGWVRTEMGGPAAHLDPAFSASSIFSLIEEARSGSKLPPYVDYSGKALPW
jgi:NAD(P)-dependent dehydrogenase (short-subunit alcohol dehydrogenase family)